MTFDHAFDILLGHEGGYSNHPSDPGGETMWGVTARVARADGYRGDMRDLPRERAKDIYRRLYWDTVRADELPAGVRFDVFDGAVNSGPARSIEWLQESCGATVDGKLGPKTLAAARAVDGALLSKRYNGHRLQFMTDLGTWGSFGKGWARRIASNLRAS